jgi:hypothetical protein
MVFNKMEVWVRVLDLPLDMMNRVYGELIGNWIGEYRSVDVEEDGTTWGEELRIRVAIRVDQPLLHGVRICESEEREVGHWFDLKYEKIPHFCFDCGLLIHPDGKCLAEKQELKQWGKWLRCSPGRKKKAVPAQRPTVSSGSFSSHSGDGDSGNLNGGGAQVRDLPPRRSLFRDYTISGSSRTGEVDRRKGREEVRSPIKNHWVQDNGGGRPSEERVLPSKTKRGTYVRKGRNVCRGDDFRGMPRAALSADWRPRSLHGVK